MFVYKIQQLPLIQSNQITNTQVIFSPLSKAKRVEILVWCNHQYTSEAQSGVRYSTLNTAMCQ